MSYLGGVELACWGGMEPKASPPPTDRFTSLTAGAPKDPPGVHTVVTRDHDVIRQWAATHAAEPASGEHAAGPAVRSVNDSGAGIRFNFPGFSPFTPISWDDWFANFEAHTLSFVFEEDDPQQSDGQPREHDPAAGSPVRYRVIPTQDHS